MTKKQKKTLIRIIVTTVLLIVIAIAENTIEFPNNDEIQAVPWDELKSRIILVMYLFPYAIIGYDILKKAYKGIVHGQVLDENFLMAVATIGSMILGEYREGVMVMLLYQIGELFQSVAVGKSRRNIAALMDIRPDVANLVTEENGEEIIRTVSPDEVEKGSILVVSPGERIPIDGIVISGDSTIDTSALTGESVPRSIHTGDEVISGTINQNGVIRIRTTKPFGESTVTKILELVENASSQKSRSENFITRFARVYTPFVCLFALVIAVIPPIINMVIGNDANFRSFIYRALTFLVISCPCAMVISIPLGFFAGIGGASRAGILVKGSNYLEALSKIDTVIFDKTGTLTKGVFKVVSIHRQELSDQQLLKYAAYAESFSSHPISRSIVNAYGIDIDKSLVSDVEEISGHGVLANVSGSKVIVGNDKMMTENGIEPAHCHDGGTIIHIAVDGRYAGHIHISDVIKDSSPKAVSDLHKMGISRTIMLTGDAEKVAEKVAETLSIKEYRSELLPGDKVSAVEEILNTPKNKKGCTAFVGDGINDAPVLTRVDVGIAMGALGSDAAIEAADVVIMDDDPMGVIKAIRIGKKCMRIAYENIYFAIGVKVIVLILSAFGLTNMWLAVFADVGVMILAVLNAIRTLRIPHFERT
ncbi:MAG: cadmium-translocating P-type ATPase [Lachnospiraceae bacterium]|nr:cadmium-translocating P-type ATPase [Lachnospiraceae bacterium]